MYWESALGTYTGEFDKWVWNVDRSSKQPEFSQQVA